MKRPKKKSVDDNEVAKPQKNGPGGNSGAHRKRIRWVHDDRLFKMRFFRINDEPIADGLTDAQVRDFRDRLIREVNAQASSQSTLRGVSCSFIQTDSGAKSSFSTESVAWSKPRGTVERALINYSAAKISARCGRLIIILDRICLTLGVFRGEIDEHAMGKNSSEKKQHEVRIASKIACYFAREYQIPDKPSFNLLNNARGNQVKTKSIPIVLFKENEVIKNEIESNPNASLTYLTEHTRKQLSKKVGKSSVKKVEEDSEKSEYSEEYDGEIDQEDELLGIAQFVGMMGQSFSNYKAYIKSLSRLLFL